MGPRIAIALLASLCLIAAEPDEEAVKKELKKLDGTWLASQTSVENDNGKLVKFTQNFRLVIRDEDRFTLFQKFSDEKEFKELATGTFTVDPGKKPREMDMKYIDQEGASKCIYEFDGTTLKLMGGKPGGPRPKEFDKEKTLVFKREVKKKK
jgi:uncharacterized protein (TIGR03067 family)